MARPIESTPVLYGEDAERLLEELKDCCSPEEMERRIAVSKKRLAEMMRPKGYPKIAPRGVKNG